MPHTQATADKFEIVVNGKPLILDADDRANVSIDEDLPLAHRSWIAAAIGPWHRLVPQQHSDLRPPSPVYVNVGDERVVSAQGCPLLDRADR
jgi:hypothetical protein